MSLSTSAILRVKSIQFVPIRKGLHVLQFLRLAPTIVGEHYRVYVNFENLTDKILTNVRLEFIANVRIGTSLASMPAIKEIGNISARDIKAVCAYDDLLTRVPSTEDFMIVDAYARCQGVSKLLPFEYQGKSSPSYLDVYSVEPRRAVYDRMLNLLLFIFAAISAYGALVHH